jgi:hypothetical protein
MPWVKYEGNLWNVKQKQKLKYKVFTIFSLQILKYLPVSIYGHLYCHILYTRLYFVREIKCYSPRSSVLYLVYWKTSRPCLVIFGSKNRSEHGGKWKKGSTYLKCVLLSTLVIFLSHVNFIWDLFWGWLHVLGWTALVFFLTDFYKIWYTYLCSLINYQLQALFGSASLYIKCH